MDDEGNSGVIVSVLGDVSLHADDGSETELSPQRRHILAVLAAGAGSVVPRSELLDELWKEDSDAARHRLKSQIAQLRLSLGADLAIQYHLDGYRLRGSLDRLDSTLFESLVTGARQLATEQRAEQLGVALGLWRDPVPFLGVDSVLVDDARHRLELLRAATIIELADCEIELQRPGKAIDLLEHVMEHDPTRADVVARLANLLALAHREVDALRFVRRHRQAVVDLGYTLTPEIEELETRLLRREFIAPAILQQPRTDTAFHADASLIERAELQARVAAGLAAGPVIVYGEAGVGKTVLTLGVAGRLERDDRIVIRVGARPDPLRPMDVIVGIVERFGVAVPEVLDARLARPALAAAVARLAGEHTPALPAVTRDVLISELTELIRTVLTSTPCVLIVEDAHWLDNSSAEIIGNLLVERLANVLITSRRPLDEEFGVAWRHPTVIEMPPFTIREVRAMIERSLPARATDELAAELHGASGGNGIFLRLVLDLLADGQLGQNLSPTLLDAVSERTRRLSEATRVVLQTSALLGQTFRVAVLAHVHPHWSEALRHAEEERLVRLDVEAGTGAFVHGLVVEALVDLLPSPTRIARQDQLCRALMALDESPTAIATQAVGAEALDPIRAVVSCLRAAEQQAVVFEWTSTIDWARLGIEIASRSAIDDPQVEAQLRAMLGTGLRRLSRPGSDVELERAADLAFASDAHELLVRTVTELCLHGPTTSVGSVDVAARLHLDRALSAPVEPLQRAELLAAAATLLSLTDEESLGRSLYREALDLAEAAGDPPVLRAVRLNAHLGLSHPDDLAARRRAAEGLLALHDHEARWEGSFLRFGLALIDADRRGLDEAIDVMRGLTSMVKQRDYQRALSQTETVYAFILGDLERAERLAEQTLRLSLESYPESRSLGIFAALLIPIREVQGRAGDLLSELTALIDSAPDFVTWHVLAANAAYARGDQATMASRIAHLARLDYQFAEDLTWTAAATLASRPLMALNDATSAAAIYERLLPHRGRMTWNGLSTHGPVDAGLACLAAVLDDLDAVADHVAEATRLVERLNAPHLGWPELAVLTDRLEQAQRSRAPVPAADRTNPC